MPIPEVSKPTNECPDPEIWHCYDAMSAEVEVLDFLYQFVKTVKPKLVVETGSYRGLGAVYIGKALKENGRGKLITCEIDRNLHQATQKLINKARMLDVVECRLVSSLDMQVEGDIDILFSDSLPEIRMKEIDKFWPQLKSTSTIIVHDVNSGDHHALRETVIRADKDRKISVVLLPTPRGLAICQKREGRE